LDKANLQNAFFNSATITGARMAGATLEGADMTDAVIEPSLFQSRDGSGATFLETSWWMAVWSTRKLADLEQEIPHKYIVKGHTYPEQIKRFDIFVDYYNDAAAFNNRAWYRATCGAELDIAEKDARQARLYDPKLDRA